jgi:hypothetical protein
MRKLLIFNLVVLILVSGCKPVQKMPTSPSAQIAVNIIQNSNKDSFVSALLSKYPEYFESILKLKKKYNVQIIYTRIDRLSGNKPVFTDFYFNVDSADYRYPASTIKLPIAALALQKVNELNIPGLNKYTTMITEAKSDGQTAVYNDPTTPDGRPTIAHYIRKILLVSDNDASNRLYEFLGQAYINYALQKMGYDSAQIVHRLSVSLNETQNRTTNRVKFYNTENKILWEQPEIKSDLIYHKRNEKLGKGYIKGEQLINEPFDFSRKNKLTLIDLHLILRSLIFPESLPQIKRFNLTTEDYQFLYKYMSMVPGESKFPQYDSTYYDAYVKFLLFGGKGKIGDSSIRIFNKVGDAYGFLTDAAYIVDFRNGIEFLLSASIYCNNDEIFNDDKYDYDSIGFPFMKNLGAVIYQQELKRIRKIRPDLSRFNFNYAK